MKWYNPIKEILALSNHDLDRAKQLVTVAVNDMNARPLVIASPLSIMSNVLNASRGLGDADPAAAGAAAIMGESYGY